MNSTIDNRLCEKRKNIWKISPPSDIISGGFYPIRPVSGESLEKLGSTLKLAEMALTKEILHIPKKTGLCTDKARH